MGEIDRVLSGDEQVLWEGRPAPLPYFASTLGCVALGLLLLVPTLHAVASSASGIAGLLFLAPLLLVGCTLTIGMPVYRIVAFLHISYAITDKRVLLQRGIIDQEVVMVDFDQIGEAAVERNLADLLLGFGRTGSVRLAPRSGDPQTANAEPDSSTLSHVARPYDVFAFFHRAEYDVKTDIAYPNGLRPEANPGYDTTYPPPPGP